MGAGIAQVCVEAGFETIGREVESSLGEKARSRIDHFLTRKVEKGQLGAEDKDAALARLSLTTELDALAGCDLVIEAVFEELGVKHEVFRALEQAVADDVILATNTSAL